MGHRLTPAAVARKQLERAERRLSALLVLQDWGGPAPPICGVLSIRELASLTADGLAEFVGRDRLDDPRYRITPAGEAFARQALTT